MNQLRHRISYYDLHGGLEVKIRSPKPAHMVRLTLFLIASFSFFALVALNFLQEEPWSFFFVIWTTFFVGFFLHFLPYGFGGCLEQKSFLLNQIA